MSDELDRLITQWAARHAQELIAQAQADALELARERLRARLVDALLAAAEARLTERPPQPREAGDPLVWAYGVVPEDSEPEPRKGVDGHPVRLHLSLIHI